MKGNTMLKVHILGGGGSGKTTLAQEIAAMFHIPHYELDMIGRKNGLQDAAYLEDALAIAAQPGWVAEASSLVWTDLLLQQANYIVLLEVPWMTAASRIIRRHIIKSLQGTNLYPGIKTLFFFLQGESDYYLNRCSADTAELARRYLAEHEERVEPLDAESLRIHREKYGLAILVGGPTAEFVRSYLKRYHQKVMLVKNNTDRKHLFEVLARQQENGTSLPDET